VVDPRIQHRVELVVGILAGDFGSSECDPEQPAYPGADIALPHRSALIALPCGR
jgi:hypothetical protein